MSLFKKPNPELGNNLEVGDIIQGRIYDAHLKVLRKYNCDEDIAYVCKYIDGVVKGETEVLYSYYTNYFKVR